MICYWIRVYARLNEPVEILDKKGRAVVDGHTHYFQNFGVTAESLEKALVPIEEILWANNAMLVKTDPPIENVDFRKLSPAIRSNSADPSRPGVWHQSGRGFYTE